MKVNLLVSCMPSSSSPTWTWASEPEMHLVTWQQILRRLMPWLMKSEEIK